MNTTKQKIKRLFSLSKNTLKNKNSQKNSNNSKNSQKNNNTSLSILTNSYTDLYYNLKQISFGSHNIQGGFKNKLNNILLTMIILHLDFLHVCETNEIDKHFSLSKNKASTYYTSPSTNN